MVRRVGVLRIHARDTTEVFRILLENIGQVAVIPAVMNHLDDDRFLDVVGLHQRQKRFRSGILGGRCESFFRPGVFGSFFQTCT